jgi:hypothetical protein
LEIESREYLTRLREPRPTIFTIRVFFLQCLPGKIFSNDNFWVRSLPLNEVVPEELCFTCPIGRSRDSVLAREFNLAGRS